MTDTLRIKRRTSGAVGPPSALGNAEIAFNEMDNTLYYGKGGTPAAASSIIPIAGTGAYLPLTGGALSGGLGFGSTNAASTSDLTRHIALWAATVGFNVTANRLNIITASVTSTVFVNNANDILTLSPAALFTLGGPTQNRLIITPPAASTTNVAIATSGTAGITVQTSLTMPVNQPIQLVNASSQLMATGNDGVSMTTTNTILSSFNGLGFASGINSAGVAVPLGLNAIWMGLRGGSIFGLGNVNFSGVANNVVSSLGNLSFRRSGTDQQIYLDVNTNVPSLTSSTPAAGGTGVAVNDHYYDAYNNLYVVTAVDGTTAATTISMLSAAARTGVPPANPIALTASPSYTGTGITVNLTWTPPARLLIQNNVAAGTLALGAPGGISMLNPVTLAADPTTALGAATKQYADKMLPLTGGALSGGLSFGSTAIGTTTDLSRHIALYGTTYGFNVSSSRLNYVGPTNATHRFVINAVDVGWFSNTGLTMGAGTAITLVADPTTALQAATKQYVDNMVPVTISDTAPSAGVLAGDLWWDSVGTQLYIRFNDGTSTQWVASTNAPSSGTTFAVASIAALRALTATSLLYPSVVTVEGYTGINTRGGGNFVYVSSDTTTADDGGTVIVDAASRRWWRQNWNSDATNVCWFGAVGDNTADDTTAFNNALAFIATLGGGKLYIPGGTYKTTGTLNYSAGFLTIMGDGKQSVIAMTSLTLDTLVFTGSDITLTDFRITHPYNTVTAGVVLKFLNANNAKLTRLWVDGGYHCVQFLGSTTTTTYRATIHDCNFVNIICNGVFYDQYFGGVGTISNLELLAAPGQTSSGPRAGNGIIVYAGDTFTWTNINAAGFYMGINIVSKPGGIEYAANFLCTNVLGDSNGYSGLGHGWTMDGTATANSIKSGTPGVTRVFLSSCWSGGMDANGFNLVNVTHVSLNGCVAIASGLNGVNIQSPCADITLTGCHIYWSSRLTPNTWGGVLVTNATDFSIVGCSIKPTGYWLGGNPIDGSQNTQKWAVEISGGTPNCDRYIITNNDVSGNLGATAIVDGGLGVAKLINNNMGG
jgi:hypothetical protein